MVIPATGVEGMSLELLNPWNPRQLRLVQWPTRHDHKARLEHIVAIGRDRPASGFLVPARLLDLRLEASLLVEIEMLGDPLGMGEDLRLERVSFLRDIAGLFQQGQIEVAFNVTLGTRIAV